MCNKSDILFFRNLTQPKQSAYGFGILSRVFDRELRDIRPNELHSGLSITFISFITLIVVHDPWPKNSFFHDSLQL